MADWPFSPPIVPMEAELSDELPRPPGWAYEPKWDGFRAVAWSSSGSAGREGAAGEPRLESRNGKPLLRYFPELRPALDLFPPATVTDGEVVVAVRGRLDFDALQNRIHPAESRIIFLSSETPAALALFDLLALEGHDLRGHPFEERRRLLVQLAEGLGAGTPALPGEAVPDSPTARLILSPSTTDVELARRWFYSLEPAGFDGIVAKLLDHPYVEGRRAMIKVKHRRTVDAVVGGYRLHKDGRRVGSLLLGLYDEQGELHFIGHCSSFSEAEATALLPALRQLETASGHEMGSDGSGPPTTTTAGFGEHARRPGRESRWTGDKDLSWTPVRPDLVIEVSYDQLTGDRFRHATRFERWRPDKDPRDCTLDQLERPKGLGLAKAPRRAREESEDAKTR